MRVVPEGSISKMAPEAEARSQTYVQLVYWTHPLAPAGRERLRSLSRAIAGEEKELHDTKGE
jgi:hypothetical protein